MHARLTALLVALLLAAAALVACTGDGDEAGPGEAKPTATPSRITVRTRPVNPPPLATVIPTPERTPESAGVAADRAVLTALYHATGGRDWKESKNWLTYAPLGAWYGVTTDSDGRVTELALTVGLTGSIPPELGNLTRLERLVLGGSPVNDLSGPIPPELGMLIGLKELVLSHNNLSGPVPPEFGGLVQLETLDLTNNELSGHIPAELGGLVRLEELRLSGNQLSGPIPAELGGLAGLKELWLSVNQLSGPIPAELGGLVRLEVLLLGWNNLSGHPG